MDEQKRNKIWIGKQYKFVLENEDIISGTAHTKISGQGIVIETCNPEGRYYIKWEKLKSAEPLPPNTLPRISDGKDWEWSEDKINTLKNADKIRVHTCGGSILTGKTWRFFEGYFYMRHPICECVLIRIKDVKNIEIWYDDIWEIWG